MRKLILASIFILCFSFFAFAQVENLPCPTITIESLNKVTEPGSDVTFTAVIGNNLQEKDYDIEWSVNQGIIISGQKTLSIKVASTEEMNASNLEAAVKIIDFPKHCNNKASEVAPIVEEMKCYGELDTYEKEDIEREFLRFDALLYYLNSTPGMKAFVSFEFDKTEDIKTVKERFSRIIKHIKEKKYDPNRLTLEACRSKKHLTSIWILEKDKGIISFAECVEEVIKFN